MRTIAPIAAIRLDGADFWLLFIALTALGLLILYCLLMIFLTWPRKGKQWWEK